MSIVRLQAPLRDSRRLSLNRSLTSLHSSWQLLAQNNWQRSERRRHQLGREVLHVQLVHNRQVAAGSSEAVVTDPLPLFDNFQGAITVANKATPERPILNWGSMDAKSMKL